MQQENPQFYSGLTSHLSPDEQSVIQHCFNQAEANAQAAVQMAANAAQSGQIAHTVVPNGGLR